MNRYGLTFNSRKALMNNIGEAAGTEIANLISEMAAEIDELRRNKVNVTRIVPGDVANNDKTTGDPRTISLAQLSYAERERQRVLRDLARQRRERAARQSRSRDLRNRSLDLTARRRASETARRALRRQQF
ncbi:MAG: hypothetical protein AAGJ83_08035, partial [Planctomycetota bacterium]